MSYAAYQKSGFPIESGIIENECKNVFGARFKLGGQRWKKKRICRRCLLFRLQSSLLQSKIFFEIFRNEY